MRRELHLIGLAAGAVMIGLGSGCARSPKRPTPIEVGPSKVDRVLEAQRVAYKAQAAQRRADVEEAMELYGQAVVVSRDHPGAWNNLGVILTEQIRYMEAAEALRMAADRAPSDPRPMSNLGVVYHRTGHSDRALECYERALSRDPNWLPAIRGAIVSAKLVNRAEEVDLDRVRRGLMLENDEEWREFFLREQMRLRNVLRSRENQLG